MEAAKKIEQKLSIIKNFKLPTEFSISKVICYFAKADRNILQNIMYSPQGYKKHKVMYYKNKKKILKKLNHTANVLTYFIKPSNNDNLVGQLKTLRRPKVRSLKQIKPKQIKPKQIKPKQIKPKQIKPKQIKLASRLLLKTNKKFFKRFKILYTPARFHLLAPIFFLSLTRQSKLKFFRFIFMQNRIVFFKQKTRLAKRSLKKHKKKFSRQLRSFKKYSFDYILQQKTRPVIRFF